MAPEKRRRVHLSSNGSHSDTAMDEALHDMPDLCEFVRLGEGIERLPDENTILLFMHLLAEHSLSTHMLRLVNGILQAKMAGDEEGQRSSTPH